MVGRMVSPGLVWSARRADLDYARLETKPTQPTPNGFGSLVSPPPSPPTRSIHLSIYKPFWSIFIVILVKPISYLISTSTSSLYKIKSSLNPVQYNTRTKRCILKGAGVKNCPDLFIPPFWSIFIASVYLLSIKRCNNSKKENYWIWFFNEWRANYKKNIVKLFAPMVFT